MTLSGDRLPPIASAPPVEFDGPGDRWSPETLFGAAVADCYVLTFCAVAAVFKLPWTSIRCQAVGIVERPHRVTQFVEFDLEVQLNTPADVDREHATRVLVQAKHACLVTSSLKAPVTLETAVVQDAEGAAA
jgi:organic hydroperoxide reductase OsmC/OhrA